MAYLQKNDYDIDEYGNEVTVAENAVAKLMYYLNCVCLTIDLQDDKDISRFKDYHHWSNLSIDDQKRLLVLCYTLSPDILEDKVFFESAALCKGEPNRLYKIQEIRNEILVVSNIIIAGRSRKVNKIMAYTMPWMQYCYLQPMKELAQRFGGEEEESPREEVRPPRSREPERPPRSREPERPQPSQSSQRSQPSQGPQRSQTSQRPPGPKRQGQPQRCNQS